MKSLPKGTMDKVNKNVAASKAAKPPMAAPGLPVKKIVTKTVHFGSDAPKKAPVVKSKKQAVAIAMSEAGMAKKKGKK